MCKRRADVELVARGLYPSRERARAAILAGEVRADGVRIEKPGQMIAADTAIEIRSEPRYVSRGGHKLERALDAFRIDVTGSRAIDVGASTGGFTDCLLKRGAASVVALDVGYGQLAWALRSDERVTVLERTNVRDVDGSAIGAPFDVVVCDVSFISFTRVLPKLIEFAGDTGCVVGLVKPQFEAGKGRVGKKGVVRDRRVHEEVLSSVIEAVHARGWVVRGVTWSPLKGPEGNIEFLVWLTPTGDVPEVDVARIVAAAHEALGD